MPATLALLRVNASAAAPRLAAPPLLAALAAARGSAALAQEALRELCSMPRLELARDETLLQLLSELR